MSRNFPATVSSGFYCNQSRVTGYFDGFLLHRDGFPVTLHRRLLTGVPSARFLIGMSIGYTTTGQYVFGYFVLYG